jgi:2'-5' RNA ligase
MGEDSRTVRTFIAIEISREAKEELSRTVASLKKAGMDVKWVKPSGMHITLKFLGNIPQEKVENIKSSLSGIAERNQPFTVSLSGIGVFPKWESPEVIWAGLDNSSKVSAVQNEIESALSGLGIEREPREFSPHITLGRVKSPRNRNVLKEYASGANVKNVPSTIDKIVLFKSDLKPSGAVYETLLEAPFHREMK